MARASVVPEPLATKRGSDASSIAPRLIAWHARHGRHDLPWQRERTAYRVWVSEIMLQQTQVATVLGYYTRFMQRFPDVRTLASAPIDEVLHLWSGLGYYSRARNLHRAAECIVVEHDGELPVEPETLEALPGIGRSTAAAIAAIAYGRRAAILDGNVRRVLSRYFGIEGARGARATELELWQRAEACTPETAVGIYTQSIMDLGATLCTRRRPLCAYCPLSQGCIGYRTGRVHELPAARARAARPQRSVVMVIAERADRSVLLKRRAAQGVWGALWTPPEFRSAHEAEQFCACELVGARLDANPLPTVQHAFTHFDLEIVPLRARCEEARLEGAEVLWYNAREPARIGLPAPIVTLLSSLEAP